MAREINGIPITDLEGGFNANALFVNSNPVIASAASNVVLVSDVTDLPAPVGNEIFLEDATLYQFNNVVDISPSVIKYGINSSVVGLDKRISGLITDSALPMLDCNGNDLTVTEMTLNSLRPIECDTSLLVIERCDFINYITAVDITSTPSAFIEQCVFANGQVGIKINGLSNLSVVVSLANFDGQSVACVQFTGAVINALTINVCAFLPGAGVGFLGDVADGNGIAPNINTRGFVLGSIFSGTALSGITKKDVKWDFQSNSGVANSTVIGGMDQVANVTSTTLITASFVQLAGTFQATGDIERFQTASNQIIAQVAGTGILTFMCDAQKVGGGGVNFIEFALFKNGIQSGDIIRVIELDINFANVTFQNDVSYVPSDVFDIRVKRVSGNDDLQVNNATVFLR